MQIFSKVVFSKQGYDNEYLDAKIIVIIRLGLYYNQCRYKTTKFAHLNVLWENICVQVISCSIISACLFLNIISACTCLKKNYLHLQI